MQCIFFFQFQLLISHHLYYPAAASELILLSLHSQEFQNWFLSVGERIRASLELKHSRSMHDISTNHCQLPPLNYVEQLLWFSICGCGVSETPELNFIICPTDIVWVCYAIKRRIKKKTSKINSSVSRCERTGSAGDDAPQQKYPFRRGWALIIIRQRVSHSIHRSNLWPNDQRMAFCGYIAA